MGHEPRSIGLRRGAVILRDYDPRWVDEFAQEAARLQALLGGHVLIEHVGSTAVPGLPAKPLIDIALAFASRDALEDARDRLMGAGYDYRGDFGDRGGVILAKGPDGNRTHLLHLVERTDNQWDRYLAFRDALRADAALRDEYAATKQRLSAGYWDDREAYVEGKRPFIERVAPMPGPTRSSVE
jgi:GrpB-like predicted nucleotidyltransferase (UPF0157 family)